MILRGKTVTMSLTKYKGKIIRDQAVLRTGKDSVGFLPPTHSNISGQNMKAEHKENLPGMVQSNFSQVDTCYCLRHYCI